MRERIPASEGSDTVEAGTVREMAGLSWGVFCPVSGGTHRNSGLSDRSSTTHSCRQTPPVWLHADGPEDHTDASSVTSEESESPVRSSDSSYLWAEAWTAWWPRPLVSWRLTAGLWGSSRCVYWLCRWTASPRRSSIRNPATHRFAVF